MRRLPSSSYPWLFFVAMVWCAFARGGTAATLVKDPDQFLRQTESIRKTDHSRFVSKLAEIHQQEAQLTSDERWHLRYLDTWETMFEGGNVESRKQLQDIIEHSHIDALIYKASGLLLSNLTIDQRYTEAFALANKLTTDLPLIKDQSARFQVLSNLSQMLDKAGQTDLSLKYAHMLENDLPPGETLCYPIYLAAAALRDSKRLTSSSPELKNAIDTCVDAGEPVVANAARLILSSLYLEDRQPLKVMRLLDRISPSLRTVHYQPQLLSAQVMRARAYAMLGRDNEAVTAALAAVAMGRPDTTSEVLRDAYEVLYRIEKKRGETAAALDFHEHYMAQDKGYLNDVSAQAIAFQTVQQQVLTRKLETEELGKQNSILLLQQALDTKAVEASRLYIALLLSLLASIAFWLYRIKRSQLRFQKQARHDGLTGILNHQHFMNEAMRILSLSEHKRTDVSLVSIDLDHFKRVNDTHGHAMGDEVLRHAVEMCKKQLRASDVFGRLGGEEFGILLPGCSREKAKGIADCIRKAIGEAAVERTDVTIWISASVGLACTSNSGYALQNLCKDADAALYRAKRAGRNRVEVDVKDSSLTVA
jgi:diguanylate cyclase (GGDEF)-like protein